MNQSVTIGSIKGIRMNNVSLYVFYLLVLLAGYVLLSTGEEGGATDEEQTETYENASGKNGKHANLKAKEKATEKVKQLKEQLKDLNAQKKTKEIKKQIAKVKKQIKHWQRRADWKGETHSRTAKGS